jgi:hypothetical protein
MDGMVLVLIAVVLVAAVVAVVVLRGRPRGTDLDSVRSYHTALGTLEHLSERQGPPVRVIGPSDDPDDHHATPRVGSGTMPVGRGAGGPAEVPPVPVRGNDEFPDPETPLVFDDARPRDRHRGDPALEGVPVHRVDRDQRHALEAMNHRPRRGLYILVVVAVVAAFAVLAYTGSKRSTPTKRTGGSTSSTTAARAAGGSSPSSTTRPKHSGSPAHTPKPTPTTLPATLVAVTSTDTSATYTVPFSTYQLTVTTTTSPSWVQATTVSTGSILWAGTLQPGTKQVIQAVGTVSIQIGVPSVTMAVGKIPVVLPTVVHTPFAATFQPAVASVPTTTTTTSVPVTATSG